MATSADQQRAVSEVLLKHGEARSFHDSFVSKVESRYRCYRGILDRRSDAAQYTSKLVTQYVMSIVETIVANVVDDKTVFRMRPRPRRVAPDEVQATIAATEDFERLLAYQLDTDNFNEKQRPFVLQGSIAGLTAAKQSWLYRTGTYRHKVTEQQPVYDPFGNIVTVVPTIREVEVPHTFHDDPTTEIVDVRDLVWPESATDLSKCPWLIHRVWLTFEDLKRLEAQGTFKNVDKLKDGRDFKDDWSTREQDIFKLDRSKDRVEVMEYWTAKRVITIGNRSVLLRDAPNPFWFDHLDHNYPFVIASPTPDLFQIPGISDVERMESLQTMLWTLQNQRIDNLLLINNAIVMLRDDVDDPDSFEFVPGAKWVVQDPSQVQMWSPDVTAARVSLEAESMLKTDLQNATGGMPFLGGVASDAIDQKTATGVSIVTTLAQRLIAARKRQYASAFTRIGDQWISLDQQFITEPRLIEVIGADGAREFRQVYPDTLQGQFRAEVEPVAESFMRQERRAEAQALMQIAAATAPAMLATGTPWNLKAFGEVLLEAFDVRDKDRFFSQAQPQMGQSPGMPGQPAPQGPGGVTSPLASGPLSPSNKASVNPAVFMQRLMAIQGGPVNA